MRGHGSENKNMDSLEMEKKRSRKSESERDSREQKVAEKVDCRMAGRGTAQKTGQNPRRSFRNRRM